MLIGSLLHSKNEDDEFQMKLGSHHHMGHRLCIIKPSFSACKLDDPQPKFLLLSHLLPSIHHPLKLTGSAHRSFYLISHHPRLLGMADFHSLSANLLSCRKLQLWSCGVWTFSQSDSIPMHTLVPVTPLTLGMHLLTLLSGVCKLLSPPDLIGQ